MHSNPSRWTSKTLWVVVLLLFFGNVALLITPGSDYEEGQLHMSAQVDEQRQAFERLSFWQQLLENAKKATRGKHSAFDGLAIDGDFEERVLTVMIDNFVAARAQHSGIRQASLVYEALVEGGITRLMLVSPYQESTRVGPVRSARDYLVSIAEEYGGIHVHEGGSPLAMDLLDDSLRVYHLQEEDEEGVKEPYSFRDENLEMPHDLFFDLLAVRDYAERKNWDLQPSLKTWCFTEEDQQSGMAVADVAIDYSNDPSSSYYVSFRYDEDLDTYKRWYGKTAPVRHVDQSDDLQVAPRNLIVQVIPSHLIEGDEKERLALSPVGQGDAYLYRQGRRLQGFWQKADENSPTQFLDALGAEMCLSPGQTWVAIVDDFDLIEEK